MLDIQVIREHPERVKNALQRRGESIDLDKIIDFDERRKVVIQERDELRGRRNSVSKKIGALKTKPQELISEMRDIGDRIKTLEAETRNIEDDLSKILLLLPNIPNAETPDGDDENDNVVIRTSEITRSFDFVPLPHWEIGENLGIIDFERGAKISGSRFYILKGKGAILQRALISWMLDIHVRENGYEEMYLPDLVNQATAAGSGQLPKFADNMYHDEIDDLWLVPTAEVPITGLYSGEIIEPGLLPLRYVSHTPCFRREKAAAGRDTRGIKRVHQFEKVEMYKLVEPENSERELEGMLADAETICKKLDIPHQVKLLCTGDLGFAANKTYDIELWAPGCQEWLEVSSCSNCGDFQSRRANIRYRQQLGDRPKFLHSLNGSGLGIARVLIAVLENYQQSDGSVIVPEVLRPYTGFEVIM